jgi:hypothetical protein
MFRDHDAGSMQKNDSNFTSHFFEISAKGLLQINLSAQNRLIRLKIHVLCDFCSDPVHCSTHNIDLGTNFNTLAFWQCVNVLISYL